MCYSGRCIWEQYSGDCGFPTIKAVRDKYPVPLCTIATCEEEDEYMRSEEFTDKIKEIKELVIKNKKQ